MAAKFVTREEALLDILVKRPQGNPQPHGRRLGVDEFSLLRGGRLLAFYWFDAFTR